ncbi:MAG TPA: hypothetical protein VMT00_09155 [Thermoanaerobaculia bacterium]|nr:hypothetical protein [Thermoanaerobaculia bacterium]
MSRTSRWAGIAVFAAVLGTIEVAEARALHWKDFRVTARLDAEGRLHVKEQQTIVFIGDWNGGERTFRPGIGGKLDLHGMYRIENPGEEGEIVHPLQQGSLDIVDHYDWTATNVLRWRSRKPSDPPFDSTLITYRIDYVLSNILRPLRRDGTPSGRLYRLDHDFAFSDRIGVIDRFALHLDIDPIWRGPSTPIVFERRSIPPGSGVQVVLPLEYMGEEKPAAVTEGAPLPVRFGAALLLLSGATFGFARFYRGEKAKQRFDPLVPVEAIDAEWLQNNLISMKPEVVGAAWDDTTSAPEVAAVLARMAQEGKIESSLEPGGFLRHDVLKLHLKVDRDELKGYEARLVKSLFIAGDTTDTERIRTFYRKRGFNPAGKIEEGIRKVLNTLPGWRAAKNPFPLWTTILLIVVTLAGLVAAAFQGPVDLLAAIPALVAGVFVAIFGSIAASIAARNVTAPRRQTIFALLCTTPLFGAVLFWCQPSPALRAHPLTLAALVAWALAILHLVIECGRNRESSERLAVRRRLASARRYFIHELERAEPRLRDEWFPYVLAFGLERNANRWFRAFGGETVRVHLSTGRGSFAGGGSHSGWTGGGGAFGGAGASGSWGIAASSLASGVSAASSSGGGSGGGGGGGGGGSGGGGGGGW